MVYSEADLAEFPHDRARPRAYFWRMAQRHRRLAAEHRRDARRVSFAEGLDHARWANTMEGVTTVVLDSLDSHWLTRRLQIGLPHA